MDRYIEQLAEDFRAVAEKVPTSDDVRKHFNIEIPEELEMVAYAELYLRVPPQKLSDILGIEKSVLPPPKALSLKQISFLYNEMIQLLNCYYFSPDFPTGLPVKDKYRMLYDHWDQKYIFTGKGTVHIEFCDYEPSRCPFPKRFCQCKGFETE